ncbi:MAG: hypothetical protein IKR71_09025 [Bacteroidales bacterium]|nr:hypothetical protein [Bacteroidales bacterium]
MSNKDTSKTFRTEKLSASPMPKPIAKEKIQESKSPQPKPQPTREQQKK